MEESDRITLRLERDNLERLDAFLRENREYGSRSQLCRIALQRFLEDDRCGTDEVKLRIPRVLMDYVDALVNEGYFMSREHAVLRGIEAYFSRDRMMEIEAHKKEIGKATGKIFPVAGGDGVIQP